VSDQADEQRRGVKPDSDSPEWWAMGAELCTCGHRLDLHREVVDSLGDGTRFECRALDCYCGDFALTLDKCKR
jgi:hypothetical protein